MEMSTSEQRLREYIEEDLLYQAYKKRDDAPNKGLERFYYVHCWDIENVLNELEQLKNDNAVMKAGLIQIRDEQLEQYKSVLDEIREYIENHIMLIYTKNAPREMVGMKELLQILDKVKENERGTTESN